uniref:Uncharacterized protein n=1 Tax=Anguilla anguilla TaxID=7936 RepID=A0A0E9XBZ9_ANGAN
MYIFYDVLHIFTICFSCDKYQLLIKFQNIIVDVLFCFQV